MLLLLRRLKALSSLCGDADAPHVCGAAVTPSGAARAADRDEFLADLRFGLWLAVPGGDGRRVGIVGSFDEDNRGGLPFGLDVPNDATMLPAGKVEGTV